MKNESTEMKKAVFELPTLISEEELDRQFTNYPREALLRARTPAEFGRAVRELVGCQVRDPDWVEGLLAALFGADGHYPFDEKSALVEWYVTNGIERLDRDIIRAFRFIMNGSYLYWCRREVCNKAVRRFPYLYWCHPKYREEIIRDLQSFTERAPKMEMYSDLDWQDSERAIRRAVQVGDYHLRPAINEILELHKTKKIRLRESDSSGDPFAAGRIVSLLEEAVKFLDDAEKEQNVDVQAFGTYLKQAGKLRGSVFVEVECPQKINLLPDQQTIGVKVSFRCSDASDRGALEKLLPGVCVTLKVESGVFPTPYRAEFCSDQSCIVSAMSLVDKPCCAFEFTPFGGKHRIWLTLAHNEFFVTSAYYVDVEESKPAEAKVA